MNLLQCIIGDQARAGVGQKRLSSFATARAGLTSIADATAHGGRSSAACWRCTAGSPQLGQ